MDLDFDRSKFSCKYGYCTGKAVDLADPKLHVKAQEYKRKIGSDFDEDSGLEGSAGTHERNIGNTDGESEQDMTEEESLESDNAETDHNGKKPKRLGYGEVYRHPALNSLY